MAGSRVRLAVLSGALAAMTAVAALVAQHTIAVVHATSLLPRWDLAAHLGHGWLDYHYLVTGQLHRLLWDLWMQGYWPPLLSLLQIPFYLVTGGHMTGGLWSTIATFVGVGVMGSSILWRQWGTGGLLPIAVFIALIGSSPFLLAYGSVTMTETLGALTQLILIDGYVRYRQQPTSASARWFAISLTLLFFTKYNYFLLLVGPLVIHEWLESTRSLTAGQRLGALIALVRRIVTSPAGAFLVISGLIVCTIVATGGFESRIWGQRISVRSIGNAGHVVLYTLLARVWWLHRRGRIDWSRIMSMDLRVRPVLLWFVVPVTLWFATPYPNHIRDFFNLVVNRPMGEATVGGGLSVYATALRTAYFSSDWLLGATVLLFVVAAAAYRRHTPAFQWLLLAVPLQAVAIAGHQTRFPRFLLLTVVLLLLVSANEVGRWCAVSTRHRRVAAWLAPAVLVAGLLNTRVVVTSEPFQTVAFELYSDSDSLREALDIVRAGLAPGDRIAVVGQNNDLSPALFRWQLGPASGAPCFPVALAGVHRQDLSAATQVLLLEGAGDVSPLDDVSHYRTQRDMVLTHVSQQALALRHEFVLPDLRVRMRLYDRVAGPVVPAPCR